MCSKFRFWVALFQILDLKKVQQQQQKQQQVLKSEKVQPRIIERESDKTIPQDDSHNEGTTIGNLDAQQQQDQP